MRKGMKITANQVRRGTITVGLMLSAGAFVAACGESSPILPRREAPPATTIVGIADNDETMGNLSEIARHISAALEDPRVRGAMVRAMKDSIYNPLGLDLSECGAGSVVGNMLRAGERRGGKDASTICDELTAGRGLILYMDRSRLHGWDSTTIPVVTAITNPDAPPRKSFHGYRSPDLVMDVPSDGSLGGPILIVLPVTTTRVALRRSASPLPSESVVIGSRGHGGVVRAGDVQ